VTPDGPLAYTTGVGFGLIIFIAFVAFIAVFVIPLLRKGR